MQNTHTYNKPKEKDKLADLIFFIRNTPIDEEWRELHTENKEYYFCSNKGRILSLVRNEPKILKPFICNGYYYVSIGPRDYRINRLVAESFIDNPDNKKVVDHIDGNKLNNDVNNLQWLTHSENTKKYFNQKKEKEEEAKSE